jgi:D-alanyl-D-alanine dipeptidase
MRPAQSIRLAVVCAVLATACATQASPGTAGPAFQSDWHRQLHSEFVRQPDTIATRWKALLGEYGPDTTLRWLVLERDQRLHVLDQHGNYVPLAARNDSVFDAPAAPLPVSGEVRFLRDSTGRAWGIRVADMVMERRAIEPPPGVTQLLITPVRPIDELRREALAAAPPAERGPFRTPDLVELTRLDSTIKLEVRYATANNFIGTPVYTQARAFLQRPAAEALVRANAALRPLGFGLLVHDGYRPWYVTRIFWDATPADKKWLVADPTRGSKHNRGAAVDVTLYRLSTGAPVEMPSTYDETTDRAKADYPGGTSLQRHYRALLRRALEHEGFAVFPSEWWHFDHQDWERYPILNVPFDRL